MLRVLIVEDEIPFLRNLVTYLASFPDEFDVVAARRLTDALKLVTGHQFDVLLTDLRLPDGDGLDFARRATGIIPGVKTVVMTAYGSDEARAIAREQGVALFLEKPLDLAALRRALRECANGTPQEEREAKKF